MLDKSAQPCIETARILYCGIVDAVENIDYDVFNRRATVSLYRRLAVAIPAWRKARKLWRTPPPNMDEDFVVIIS
jgi:phytoene synthase